MKLHASGLSVLVALLAASPAEAQSNSQLKRELRKLESAAKKDPDKLFEAGNWAAQKGLEKDAERLFKKVLKMNEDHVGANEGLGNVNIDGKWYPAKTAEKMRAKAMEAEYADKGYKEVDGVWVEPDNVADAEKGIFHHDGQVVSRDDKIALLTGKVRHPDTGELISADKLDKAKEGWFPTLTGEWIDRAAADKYHSEVSRPWVVRTTYETILSTLPLEKVLEFKNSVDQGYERVAPLFGGRAPHPDKRPVVIIARTLQEYRDFGQALGDGTDAAGAFLATSEAEFRLRGRVVRPAICENHKDWAPYYARHAAAIGYVNAIAEQAGEDLPLWFVHGCGSLTSRFQNDRDGGWFGKQHLAKGGVGNVKAFFNDFRISSDQEPTKIAFNLYQAGLLLSYATVGGNQEATDAMVAVTDALAGKGKASAAKAIAELEKVLIGSQDGIVEHLKKLVAKAP